jgi:hypothetical protein
MPTTRMSTSLTILLRELLSLRIHRMSIWKDLISDSSALGPATIDATIDRSCASEYANLLVDS